MKRSSLHKLHDLLIQSGRDIEASNLSRYMERVAIEIERDLVMDTETGQPKAQARVQPGTLTHEQMLQLGFGHSQKKGFYYTSDPAVIQRGHETAGTQGGVPQVVQPQLQPLPNDAVAPTAPVARPERPARATMQDLVPIPIGEMVLNPVERIARSGRPYARYEVEGATMEQRHMLSTAGMNWDKANKVWFVFANKVDEVVATLRIALDASHEGHADMQDKINERKEKKEAENRVDGVLSFGLEGFNEQAYESRNATDAPPGSETIPENAKTPFFPYQKRAIVQGRGKNGLFLFDDMGVGKALDLDCPILTPFGYVRMGDIHPGDFVIGSNGKPTEVLGVYPQGEREVFRLHFNDGVSADSCDEHLWAVNSPVRKRRGNPFKVLALRDIRNDLRDAAGNCKHYIPIVEPVQFEDKVDLGIQPYLLGALLGDGCLRLSSIGFANIDKDILDKVQQQIPLDMSLKRQGETCDYRISQTVVSNKGNSLLTALRYYGLDGHGSDTKFVPADYLWSNEQVRKDLLRGLLDTDGYINKSGIVQFSSNSKQLRDDVVFLTQSLGGIARKSQKVSASGKDHFICTLSLPSSWCPFNCRRKAARWKGRLKYPPTRGITHVESLGKKHVQCIKVSASDGLFVIKDFIVTHNTSTAIGLINDRAAMNLPAKNILVIAPLIVRSKWVSEIKRFMAGPGLKNQDTGQIELSIGAVKYNAQSGGVAFPEDNIVVIPWHLLAQFHDQIYARHWDLVIVDEAHRGKHPGTQWTQVLNGTYDKKQKQYTSPGFSRDQTALLTGTPPEKSWEYFSLLRIADPGVDGSNFVSEQQFRDSFAEQVKMRVPRKGKKDTNAPTGGDDDKQGMMNITVSTGPKNEDILNKILYGGGSTLDGKPINVAGVRRMLEEVQPQLPSFQSSSIEFDPSELLDDPEASKEVYAPNLERAREASKSLNDIQRSGEYGQILNVDRAIQNAIRNNQSTEEIQDLEVKLKQAMKVTFEERSPARVAMGIRKVPVVNQSIDYIRNENPTAKIVVFCVHKEVVQAIVEGERAKAVAEAEATNKENLTRAKAANQPPPELVAPRKVVVITGNESGDARDRAREQFQTDPQVKVIVCTFGAAKEGIELTAGSQLVIAEIPDTLESMDQAQRRIRRIGQTEPAFAHILLDPRGLDYVIYKNLLRNKKVRNAINASSYDRLYRLIIAGV